MAQQFGTFRRSSITKMLAAEVSRTTHALPKGEEQYEAQTYLSPTGRIVAKIMIAGVATEKEDIGKDQSLWRMRVADPSGAIGVMAGMYQPEAMQAIAQLEIPCHVVVVGKLNVYEPESESRIVSIRPDSVTIVDGQTKDDIVLDAALSTARSIKKTTADPEIMKRAAEAYDGHDQEAYMLVAQQAIESLLPPTFSAEKLDQKAPKQETAPKDQKPEESVTKTDSNDKAGEEKPPASITKQPAEKEPPKTKEKEKPAEPPKTKEKEKPAKSSPSPSSKPDKDKKKIIKEEKVGSIENGIKTIQEVVLEVLKEKREVMYTDLPNMLRNRGVNPNMVDWESAVKRLMNEGLVCEPKLGRLKAIQ